MKVVSLWSGGKIFIFLCLIMNFACWNISAGFKKYPERIISLGPTITEKIYLLNSEDQLIANTVYCLKPADNKEKEKIGTVVNINIEKIISLEPDLVIATSLTSPKYVRKLRKLNLRVEVFNQPKSFSQMLKQFLRLGKIVGKHSKSKKIVNKVNNELKKIKKGAGDLAKPKVFIQIGAKPLFAATGNSFINDFIKYAGGINIARDARYGLYSREKVIKSNPDVIIIVTMGIAGEEEKEIWSKYKTLKAAKNNRIHIIDAYKICSPTPITLIETLGEIFKLLHPFKEKEIE